MPTRRRAEVSLATTCYRGHTPFCDTPNAGDSSSPLLHTILRGSIWRGPITPALCGHSRAVCGSTMPKQPPKRLRRASMPKLAHAGMVSTNALFGISLFGACFMAFTPTTCPESLHDESPLQPIYSVKFAVERPIMTLACATQAKS